MTKIQMNVCLSTTVAIQNEMYVISHCNTLLNIFSHTYENHVLCVKLYLVKNSFLAYFVSRTKLVVIGHIQEQIFLRLFPNFCFFPPTFPRPLLHSPTFPGEWLPCKQETQLSVRDHASVAHYTGGQVNDLSALGQYKMQFWNICFKFCYIHARFRGYSQKWHH